MKHNYKILNVIVGISIITLFMSSCSAPKTSIIPTAVSSVSKVHYIDDSDLKLSKDNYQIINTETAEASVYYEESRSGDKFKIAEINDEFTLKYERRSSRPLNKINKNGGSNNDQWEIEHEGIVKLGFLKHDYTEIDYTNASVIASELAAYRLINAVQDQGADGIIEPIVTIKVGQDGKKIIYTATISAKLIKIKTK